MLADRFNLLCLDLDGTVYLGHTPIEHVAESLGVCRSRVYDLMRTRVLPSVKIGRARRVPVIAVRAYVD